MRRFFAIAAIAALVTTFGSAQRVVAADEKPAPKEDHTISLADGKIELAAPDGWVRKEPKTRIVEHEFAVPAVEGDKLDGRVTVMGAGGSVEQNMDRWVGQFSGSDNETLKPKKEKKTIAGQEVHLLDIAGTYKDQAGPFSNAPAVDRPDYRMLAAVIVGKEGNYFIKFYGPKATVAKSETDFAKMIDGLKAK